MAEKVSKREIILDAALTLFSEKGFDGVGVDLIADSVGMKGPALYHYFKGKDAILDGLLEMMNTHYAANFGSADNIKMPESLEEMSAMAVKRLEFTIHDPNIRKTRKLLAMEQFRNDKIRKLTTEHHVTGLVQLNAVQLKHLMDIGKVKVCDPELLALEYTAPVSLMVHMIDREPDREDEAVATIIKHLEHFTHMYSI